MRKEWIVWTFKFHSNELKHLRELAKKNNQTIRELFRSLLIDGKYHHISAQTNRENKTTYTVRFTREESRYLEELFKLVSPMPRSKYLWVKATNTKNYHSIEKRSDVSYNIGELKESLELTNMLKEMNAKNNTVEAKKKAIEAKKMKAKRLKKQLEELNKELAEYYKENNEQRF